MEPIIGLVLSVILLACGLSLLRWTIRRIAEWFNNEVEQRLMDIDRTDAELAERNR